MEGIQLLSITSDSHALTLGQGERGSAKLLVPNRAIPQGQDLQVKHAILLDGPFSFPEDCEIVSPVLYIDYDTSMVKMPLTLHLNHWYAGKDRQKTLTFLKASHIADNNGAFSFVKLCHGSFSDDEQFGVLELKEDLCFIAVAVQKTGDLRCPFNCGLHLLKKVQPDAVVSFRLYITYDDSAWSKVCLITEVYFSTYVLYIRYVTQKTYIFPRNVHIGNLQVAAGQSTFVHTEIVGYPWLTYIMQGGRRTLGGAISRAQLPPSWYGGRCRSQQLKTASKPGWVVGTLHNTIALVATDKAK